MEASNNSGEREKFIIASETMRKFMSMAERVARQVGSVLILGETGSGKEMTARTIHEHSLRCSKPLIEINCAALPESLVESELFGYEKGAFSGADAAKPGLFEMAHLGTIFLDEIGELDLRIQVKLLRILDRAPYYRLGGHRKITSDVRVVAATNRDLKKEIKAGRFRKDLYHRLSQFELCVPPLRERPEDIRALAEYFLRRLSHDLRFSAEALRALERYAWPGNVRELQNVVNKVTVKATGAEIGESELRRELAHDELHAEESVGRSESQEQPDSPEVKTINQALQETGGHRGRAAELLGISRRTLSRKLQQHGMTSSRRKTQPDLGSLSYEQQERFRTPVRFPVSLRTFTGGELHCTAANLGVGGIGLEKLTATLESHAELHVQFSLPESNASLELRARVAWTDTHARAGISFRDVQPAAREAIARWLSTKIGQAGRMVETDQPAGSNASEQKARGASTAE